MIYDEQKALTVQLQNIEDKVRQLREKFTYKMMERRQATKHDVD